MARLAAAVRGFSPSLPFYLFAFVFLLRLVALAQLSHSALLVPVRGDMHFYNDWSLRILKGESAEPVAFYGLPLYAYLLAAVYRVFGYNPFIPGVIQALLDAGTAVLIYRLTGRLLSDARSKTNGSAPSRTTIETFAALASVAWGFYVPAQAYSIILMPTALLVFAFWFVIWRIVQKTEAPSAGECLLLGLLIGVTAMAVATILFLVPLIAAAVIIKRAPNGLRQRVVGCAVLMTGVVLGTSPCWVHNCFVAHDRVLLSAHSGVNFWIGNNPDANGYPRFPPGLRAGQAAMLEDSITSAERAAGHPLKRGQVSTYWSNQANNYIHEHFTDWLNLLGLKARNFWNAFQYDDLSIITTLREQGIIFPGLYFGVVAALAIAGIYGARRMASARWMIAAVLLQMLAVLSVFITERYRLPVVPGLIAFGVFALFSVWRDCLTSRYRQTLVPIVVLASATAFVSWPQSSPSLWALDAYNSGWQALEWGDLHRAEQKLLLARSYVPTNPETNFALGNLRWTQGDHEAAAESYLLTLKYAGEHRGALNNLGVLALEGKQYDAAEMWLQRAEHVDPTNPKTHFLLARTLLALGDRRAAAAEIETAIRLRPAQPEFTQLRQQIGTEL